MKQKKNQGSLLLSIGTALPPYKYSQADIGEFMVRYFNINNELARKLSVIYKKSGIEYRYSALPDFHQNGQLPLLFQQALKNPTLGNRMQVYRNAALDLAVAAVKNCLAGLNTRKANKRLLPVTHLITVSCTGMSAPGLDLQLMEKLELPDHVERTSVNFMGCYAAFHALKMAHAISASNKEATVLIVLVELCSLHFQPDLDSRNMVVNSLFADGAAAILVSSDQKSEGLKIPSLRLAGFHSKVVHEGSELMTWNPTENGFLMGLDALVPNLIEEHSGTLLEEALTKFKSKKSKVQHWAIHPGGKKILESVLKGMNLSKENLDASYEVLQNFGNMSSPTIAFVLKLMMQKRISWKNKERILAAGFGPGITIETALLETVVC